MSETDQLGNASPAEPAEPASAAEPAESSEPPVPPAPWARRPRRPRRSTVLLAGLALLGGIAFATVFAFGLSSLSSGPKSGLMRPTGIPASVSTKLAVMMQLSPVPHQAAPGFTLTDQNGQPVSLASFRGSTVVLTFMDSHCTDICPLVSREFIDAYKDLGTAGRHVVFIAVNVNPYHRAVADVAAYSSAQRLSSIGSWHFVTGSLKSLRAVWSDYQIYVRAPSRNADVIHTSLIYFIDPQGNERYVTSPMVNHTKQGMAYLPPGQLAAWGRGIALVTRAATH
jgi:cytochrome oxidase Cu insertion factor (SCO1/SenC/PrrC family)